MKSAQETAVDPPDPPKRASDRRQTEVALAADVSQTSNLRCACGHSIRFRASRFGFWNSFLLPVFALTTAAASAPDSAPPSTPREFFNSGTLQLQAGKPREAEAFLETALASQDERVQPPALYNLGHVRFGQGAEELKKGPAAGPTVAHGRSAAHAGEEAIRSADEALAGTDVQKMVASYLNGRGTRRELKAATQAVRRALATHRAALNKWQRASGDFKSAVELKPADSDARQNAETMDRHIAKLVDSVRELQQVAAVLGNRNQQLGEKLKALKGRIPASDAPPGDAGDDDEDEDMAKAPGPGEKEGPSKPGEEMSLSQEQAGWLLEGFKLDSERRLPMGGNQTAEPKDRARKTW